MPHPRAPESCVLEDPTGAESASRTGAAPPARHGQRARVARHNLRHADDWKDRLPIPRGSSVNDTSSMTGVGRRLTAICSTRRERTKGPTSSATCSCCACISRAISVGVTPRAWARACFQVTATTGANVRGYPSVGVVGIAAEAQQGLRDGDAAFRRSRRSHQHGPEPLQRPNAQE